MPTKRTVGITALVAAVVVPLAAALIMPHLVSVQRYHKLLQTQLERRLGRKVSMTNLDLSLLPPSIRAENAIIAEDPRFHTGNPFVTAEELKVRVRFWPLLLKKVEIKSLELDRPRIELVKDEQGAWNFNSLGQDRNSPQQQKDASGQVELDHLMITDGQVAITDHQLRQPRAVYDHVDLDVTDFAPDRQFSLKVSALLPGTVKQAVMLEGSAGPLQQDVLKTFFDGRLHLEQVPTSAATAFLNVPPLGPIEAVVTGDATLKNSGGKMDSKGTIRFDDLHVHNVKIGYPVTFDYDVSGGGAEVIRIRHGNVKLGSTPVTVEGWLDTRTTPSQIDLKLTTAHASIAETARLASAFGVVFVQGTDVEGQMDLNLQAQGAADHPVFNGRFDARNLVISSTELSQPVKIGAIGLALSADRIRSSDFVATSGSNRMSGNFVLSQYSTSKPQVQFTLHADKINVRGIEEFFRPAPLEVAGDHGVDTVAPSESTLFSRITGGGAISADVVQYDQLVLNNSRSTVTLDHGIIRMHSISSMLYGGKQSGTIAIDTRPAQPVYSVNLKMEKVDADRLISAVSSLKGVLRGSLTANVNATFSSNSAEAIARGMNGSLELNLTNGKIMNLDLMHELAALGKFVDSRAIKPKNFTEAARLSGTFDVKDGVGRATDLTANLDGASIAAKGHVNLAEQSLDLHVMAVLNKKLSQQLGGSQIGGFMNTALANDQKELVLPIIVTGSLEHPNVATDPEQIAQMKSRDLLPTTSKPDEFTSSMLRAPSAVKSQPGKAATQPSKTPRKALKAHNTRRPQQSSQVIAQ